MTLQAELSKITEFVESMRLPPLRRVALLHAASVVQVIRGNLTDETLELVDEMTVQYIASSEDLINGED